MRASGRTPPCGVGSDEGRACDAFDAFDIVGPPLPTPRPNVDDPIRVERAIAASRLFLATAGIVAIRLDLTTAPQGLPPAYSIFVVYLGFAVLCVAALRGRTGGAWLFGFVTHLVDLTVAGMATLATEHTSAPLLVYLSFPVITAAYRWGLRETFGTAAAAIAILAAEEVFVARGALASGFSTTTLGTPNLVLRGSYLALLGLLVGYLAEVEKHHRREVLYVSRMLRDARVSSSLDTVLPSVMASIVRYFSARGALVVFQDIRSRRTFLRRVDAKGPGRTELQEVALEHRAAYLFDLPGAAVHAISSWPHRRRVFYAVGVDAAGRRVATTRVDVPAAFLASHRCRRLLVADRLFGNEWHVRVFILHPGYALDRDEMVRVATRMIEQVGPALYDRFLVQRIRSRAMSAERSRIVRELHDGPVQSLLGVEMQLAVLRRRATTTAPDLVPELARFHDVLKNEVINLREVFEGIRAGIDGEGPIQDGMADLVSRFGVYTGAAAHFHSEDGPTLVAPQLRREILRILSEALSNIRKHSGARRVTVHSAVRQQRMVLSIEDNGRGFPFVGVRTSADLRAAGEGPRTILERLRAIGGELTIDSKPGRGARLEVKVPLDESALAR